MRKVQTIMGIPISIDVPDGTNKILSDSFNIFTKLDERFSTYKEESEVSRFNRGIVTIEESSDEFRKIFNICEQLKKETGGYFDAQFDSDYDPSGYVKAYAINQVSQFLKQSGYETFLINAGGDIVANSSDANTWNIGISNPNDTKKILAHLEVDAIAVASSGNYERGHHIINPISRITPDYFKSVTIFGPSILVADVYATVIFAMGKKGLSVLKQLPGYSCIYINKNNELRQLLSSK